MLKWARIGARNYLIIYLDVDSRISERPQYIRVALFLYVQTITPFKLVHCAFFRMLQ